MIEGLPMSRDVSDASGTWALARAEFTSPTEGSEELGAH